MEVDGLLTAVCDISKPDDVDRMVFLAVSALGGLDVLINNAGISGPTAPVEQIPPDEWETGHSALEEIASRRHYKHFLHRGRSGYADGSSYSTTKWGLSGFTKTLSIELGRFNIRANAILPGTVEGPRIDRVLKARAHANSRSVDEARESALSIQSLNRFVDPTRYRSTSSLPRLRCSEIHFGPDDSH